MIHVLTTKEYMAISKPKKEKYYRLKYNVSNGLYSNTIEVEAPFKNFNAAYDWVYEKDYKPVSITFIGWK